MPELVPVRVRDCACPGTPHPDGDVVYLSPTLPLEGGITAEQQLFEAAGDGPKLTRLWLRTFVEYGAQGWNLVDEDGDAVPFDVTAILADWGFARTVADKASDIYSDTVTAPFQAALKERSPTGRTRRTTSRTRQPIPSSSD